MQLLSICCSYFRTLEDVQSQHAKLFDSVLQPFTQVVSLAGSTEQTCRQYGGERKSHPRQRYLRDEGE
jgi:hypothetical protein